MGDTCFTSLATIGGNLFTRNPKNNNNVNKGSNDIMSVITILGENVDGGETVFMMETIWMTLEKEHMLWSIYMGGVWLVPLIKFT